MNRHWVLGAILSIAACGRPAVEPIAGCWRLEWESPEFAQPDILHLDDSAFGSGGFKVARYAGVDTAEYVPGDSLPWYRWLYLPRWRVSGDSIEVLVSNNGDIQWAIMLGPPSSRGVRSGRGTFSTHDQRQEPIRIGVHAFAFECPRGA